MFWELVTVTAALAAVTVTGASDMHQPGPRGSDADSNGLTNDNTDASRISDSDNILDRQKSMAEQSDLSGKRELQAPAASITSKDGPKTLAGSDNTRAKPCPQIKKCSKRGGKCVPKGTCNGIKSKGCKKKCDCCITIQTTTDSTCPITTCPSCPTSAPCPTTGDMAGKRELQAPATNITTGEDDGLKTLDGSDNTRAKPCPQIKKCSKKGGKCVPKGTCNGIKSKGCKKTCDCCITIETTTAPPTCPKTTCPPCPNSAPCPPKGCVIIAGQCLTFSQDAKTWQDAATACTAAGGSLATLEDPAAVLAYVVQTYGLGVTQLWIGGSDIANEGTWLWLDGSPLSNFPWGINQPDNAHGNENCLEVNYEGGYNDEPCTNRNLYICE